MTREQNLGRVWGILNKSITMVLIVIGLLAVDAKSQVPPPLTLVQTIPLPGLKDGDFDHFALDVPGQRLFLAAEENAAVLVLSLRTNRVLHTIRGPKAPHSFAYDGDSNKLFVVDDGGPNQVEIYDGTTFKLVGSIPMKAHADASIYDAENKLFYVGNGGKDEHEDYCLISVIDTTSGKKLADIRVESDRVEAMAIEKTGSRLFVNLYSKGAVAVIDRKKREVVATWSIGQEGRNNGPMAFDETDHRLFVLARDPGKVVVLDSDSGKIITGNLSCVGSYDEAIYDPGLRRLYLVGVPFLKVFQKNEEGDRYDTLGQIPTAFHAETGIFVPKANLLYVVISHHGNTDAMVQIYRVVP
jgi:DNA-binding beta-propeller fold protein YncE